MNLWRSLVIVLIALAVVGLGWIGWEEHRQSEHQVKQSCIAQNSATIDGLLGMNGGQLPKISIGGEFGPGEKISAAYSRLQRC